MPEHLFECKPVDEVTTRRATDTPLHHPEKLEGSKYSLTSGLSPREQRERQSGFPFLNTRRGLILLFQLCRDPVIEVRNGEKH